MNICLFCGDLSQGGGTERMATTLANTLSEEKDINVFALSKSGKDHQTYFELIDSVHYSVLDKKKYYKVFSLIKDIYLLVEYTRKYRIDVIICVDVSLGVFSIPAQFFLKRTKFIYWDHFSTKYKNDNKRLNIIRRFASNIGDAYVTLTKEDADIVSVWTNKEVCYIKNFVPFERIETEYDIKSKRILSIGNMIPVKGFDMAIEVAEKVLNTHPDWEWHFVGDGSGLNDLIKKSQGCKAKDNMFFDGRIRNIDQEYKKASILVMTSRSEGYGLVLAEAQAFLLPTIAFDVPYGPRSIISNGIDGYLVEAFDIDQMVIKLESLMDNNALRKSFSDALKYKSINCNQQIKMKWLLLLRKVICRNTSP